MYTIPGDRTSLEYIWKNNLSTTYFSYERKKIYIYQFTNNVLTYHILDIDEITVHDRRRHVRKQIGNLQKQQQQ